MKEMRSSFFEKLGLIDKDIHIDWDITPVFAYGLFECRGDMEKVRSGDERYYYFYIDNWGKEPRLCFMERGIRHAKVLANIDAPRELLDACIREQGKALKEYNYAVNGILRQWLEDNVISTADVSKVELVEAATSEKQQDYSLVAMTCEHTGHERIQLRKEPAFVQEDEVESIIRKHDFFEGRYNPQGSFSNCFVKSAGSHEVHDQVTGLAWQMDGSGHMSYRKLERWRHSINQGDSAEGPAYRLPTIEEAMSLLNPEKNDSGFHIHPCFSTEQGYIFTADRRKPGGHWFIDFRRARVYWAAGSCFSGGFGRLCRRI